MMKRTALLLACLFAGFLIVSPLLTAQETPAKAAEKIKIGVSVPMPVHRWTGAVVWWARDEIVRLTEKYPNAEFIFVTAYNPEKQVQDLRAMMGQKVRALVVLPISDEPLAETLKEAYDQGIFIVAVDRISPRLSRDVLVAADNSAIGRMSGEFLAKAINGKGKIAIMEALPSSINTMRVQGFKEVIDRYPDIEILDSRHVNWNPATGLEVMEKFLTDHPHLDAIWTGDDSVLIRVLHAYEQSGRQDVKLIFGLGGAKEVIKMIMDGLPLVQGTINYPAAIIADSIRVAVEHVVDGQSFPREITIDCELVTRDNAGLFYNPDSLY